MTRTFFRILFILVLSNVAARSQSSRYYFDHLGTKEGLSCNTISDVIQDATGYLWIATIDGLNRYDGAHFQVFRNHLSDPGSLASNNVLSLEKDGQQNIWCGFKGSNRLSVYLAEKGSFENIFLNSSMATPYEVHDLWFDGDSLMWAGTNAGIFLFDVRNRKAVDIHFFNGGISPEDLAGDKVEFFSPDTLHGRLWFAASGHPVYFDFRKKGFFKPDGIRDWRTPVVAADERGNVWATWMVKDGLYRWGFYDPLTDSLYFTSHQPETDHSIITYSFRDLNVLSDHKIWIGNTARTPLIFDPVSRTFDYTLIREYPGALSNQTLTCSFYDRDGNLWIGTEDGLNVYFASRKAFDYWWLGSMDEFRKPRIKSVYYLGADTLVACANQRLYFITPSTGTISERCLIVDGDTIHQDMRCIVRKSAQEIYVATFGGLYSYNLRNSACRDEVPAFDPSLQPYLRTSSAIRHLIYIPGNGLYIVVPLHGILKREVFSGRSRLIPYTVSNADRMNISDICETDSGFWIAPYSHETVYFFDTRLDSITRNVNNTIPGSESISVCADRKNNLWIGTSSNGIVKLSPGGKPDVFGIEEGLNSNVIYKILQDSSGSIWSLSSDGLAQFDTEHNRFKKIVSDFKLSQYFFRDAGLAAPDGKLYCISHHILYSLNPQRVQIPDRNKPVLITAMMVSGTGRKIAASNRFQSDENTVQFQFSVFNFNPNVKPVYYYRLAGAENNWLSTNSENEMSYHGLAPGTYRFEIRSDNGTGIPGDHLSTCSFEILPPWYRTTWFLALAFSMLLALGYLSARRYTVRKMNIQKRELEKFRAIEATRAAIAGDLHDDVGATLSSINIYSKLAKEKLPEGEPQVQKLLEKINTTSQEMMNSMSDMVWAIRPEFDASESVTYRIKNFASEMLSPKEIACRVESDETGIGKISMEGRRTIFLIAKESINNIAKYSEAKNVLIRLSRQNGSLELEIQDDGIGMTDDADSYRGGNGLRSMRQRTEQLHGTFTVESGEGRGTKIKSVFSLDKIIY